VCARPRDCLLDGAVAESAFPVLEAARRVALLQEDLRAALVFDALLAFLGERAQLLFQLGGRQVLFDEVLHVRLGVVFGRVVLVAGRVYRLVRVGPLVRKLTRTAGTVCARAAGRSGTTWASRTSPNSSGWPFCRICSRAGRGCRWGRGRIGLGLSVRAIAAVKTLTS